MNLTFILKKPIITEKSIKDASLGVFTFEVAKNANKDQIKQTIEDLYNVDVVEVRTQTLPPRTYRSGRKRRERIAAATKKALVVLKKGQKIDLFDIETN